MLLRWCAAPLVTQKAIFEKNEDPYQKYGGDYGFSDESVFRALLWKTFRDGNKAHPHVVWVTKQNMKRIVSREASFAPTEVLLVFVSCCFLLLFFWGGG